MESLRAPAACWADLSKRDVVSVTESRSGFEPMLAFEVKKVYHFLIYDGWNMDDSEWQELLKSVAEIQQWFPDGVAFIGGIAVYAHLSGNQTTAKFAAMSHDADFMIRLADMADLRDIEVLTPNRRLGKQQFVKNGFEFDVYVEGQHDLPVPADEVIAWSQVKSGLRVACLEQLLVLKLKAYEDRAGSAKGDKDEDDVMRILFAGETWRKECLDRLTETMLADLEKIVGGDAPARLTGGNLHQAKMVRDKARESLAAIQAAYSHTSGRDGP